MTRLYGDQHRSLQDRFGARPMADRIEAVAVKTEIGEQEKAFIESRDMFFLTTVDQKGRPTVSYKGGAAGFVKVLDAQTIAFPSYDGNGMYYSMGNITTNPEIGILFINFEQPYRLRLQGRAEVSADDPLLQDYKEADLIVRVTLHELWMNCPRYVHRMQKVATSRYVPQLGSETPLCEWKRIDGFQDVLRPRELAAVERMGNISIEEWTKRVQSGAKDA